MYFKPYSIYLRGTIGPLRIVTGRGNVPEFLVFLKFCALTMQSFEIPSLEVTSAGLKSEMAGVLLGI